MGTEVECNGRETGDGVDIYSGYTGDADAVGAKVTEADVKGGEIVERLDSDFADIAEVLEPHRDADEEGSDKHEGPPHEAEPSRRVASHHGVAQWKCPLRGVSQPQCRGWIPSLGFARCFRLSRLVSTSRFLPFLQFIADMFRLSLPLIVCNTLLLTGEGN